MQVFKYSYTGKQVKTPSVHIASFLEGWITQASFKYPGILLMSDGKVERQVEVCIAAISAVMRALYQIAVVNRELIWRSKFSLRSALARLRGDSRIDAGLYCSFGLGVSHNPLGWTWYTARKKGAWNTLLSLLPKQANFGWGEENGHLFRNFQQDHEETCRVNMLGCRYNYGDPHLINIQEVNLRVSSMNRLLSTFITP